MYKNLCFSWFFVHFKANFAQKGVILRGFTLFLGHFLNTFWPISSQVHHRFTDILPYFHPIFTVLLPNTYPAFERQPDSLIPLYARRERQCCQCLLFPLGLQ